VESKLQEEQVVYTSSPGLQVVKTLDFVTQSFQSTSTLCIHSKNLLFQRKMYKHKNHNSQHCKQKVLCIFSGSMVLKLL